jgi:hypothetical protein
MVQWGLATIISNTILTGIAAVLIIVLVLLLGCQSTLAQNDLTFTPADKFSIPEYNGDIRFAVNGTLGKAILENGTWNFANLRLDNSQFLENLKVSAQNSKITIFSYRTYNDSFRVAILRYVVGGQGKQTFNLGFDSKEEDWSVLFNDVFMGEGDGWSFSPDSTLSLTGATNNVTIIYYTFLDSVEVGGSNSNMPFYQQHSVAIITAAAVAVTVSLAIVVKVKNKET